MWKPSRGNKHASMSLAAGERLVGFSVSRTDSMNGFRLTAVLIFACAFLMGGLLAGRLDAGVIVFEDDFEGRTAGDSLSVAGPQVGAVYDATTGTARSAATSPPGSVPTDGSIFAQGGVCGE